MRFLGPLQSLPWGSQRWRAWGSRDGSFHRPQSAHPEEGSALSQPWGPWTQTGNCPVLNAPESTVHSFIHPFNRTAAYLPSPGATAVKTQSGSLLSENYMQGLSWWLSGKESACQRRRHGFALWSGRIPHAVAQLSP